MNEKFKHIKQTGFKAPDGYFDNLEDVVFNKLNAKSNLENINSPGFNVPEDYFSTIEDKVFNVLKENEKEVKVISLFSKRNLLYYSGIAAALVLMFTIFKPDSELSFDWLNLILLRTISIHQI